MRTAERGRKSRSRSLGQDSMLTGHGDMARQRRWVAVARSGNQDAGRFQVDLTVAAHGAASKCDHEGLLGFTGFAVADDQASLGQVHHHAEQCLHALLFGLGGVEVAADR